MVESLKEICETQENVNLKNMCSMHIGGNGNLVCFPKNEKEIKYLVKFLNKTNQKYYILGNGTNTIFEDGGVKDVIICLKKMKGYKIKGKNIIADAGLNLFIFNNICKQNSLGGMEWSYGIPASVGGAVCMNAGAFGGEIKDFVEYALVLRDGRVKRIKSKNMGFGYRKSSILNSNDILIKACFKLKKDDINNIEREQKRILEHRKSIQPYGFFSAGSIFKKANHESAGKIIDKLGLKSVKIGDIEISPVHANFFVNLGNGTSKDLHKLIDYVKDIALKTENVNLEEEVIFVGEKKE